jgi:hypothetical protein
MPPGFIQQMANVHQNIQTENLEEITKLKTMISLLVH